MLNPFKTRPIVDPQLGELRRAGGSWRGTMLVETARVPLVLCGPRSGPDAEALAVARTISSSYPHWRPAIAAAMFEHYSPYAEAVAAGEAEPPDGGLPDMRTAPDVWAHASVEYVSVVVLDGELTVEIGYRVTWDEEHTLGARFRGGRFLELCGSVLAP
jgi:hypothetical protein